MALNVDVDGHLLPCGRSVEQVHDDLEAGRPVDPGCPHCAAARSSLENLFEATRALVADTAEPRPALLDRVMQAVRAERRRQTPLRLPTPVGTADVAEQAVAAVLRWAADGVPGVRARSCRITVGEGGGAHVRMSLSLRFDGEPVRSRLDDVRRRVGAALAGQVGLVAQIVDLDVVDLWDGDPA
ncbi:MAG: Asp23/Gls24 family envelope stress response protein [Pseudonocardia sp.]